MISLTRYLKLSSPVLMSALAIGSAVAQEQEASSGDVFASENAIVDTSIPFAIGAREAQQELRGAFGWPTFQEGLVEGVYFRFDPDGYARFAPTPRLETDVFEVICRPGTLNCIGRKGALTVFLNAQGAIQLEIDDVANTDSFSIVEGVAELPLPNRVLQPLDPRMETLLGSGGELVVKRGETEFSRLSLTGFTAVVSYLRWITAKQDYSILPHSWPVPNSGDATQSAGIVDWQAPMRSPQNQAQIGEAASGVESDVAEVRGELNVLRDLLVSRNAGGLSQGQQPMIANAITQPGFQTLPQGAANAADTGSAQIQTLNTQIQVLTAQLAALQASQHQGEATHNMNTSASNTHIASNAPTLLGVSSAVSSPQAQQVAHPSGTLSQPLIAQTTQQSAMLVTTQPSLSNPIANVTAHQSTRQIEFAEHLRYLTENIGLDVDTALAILQRSGTQQEAAPATQALSLNASAVSEDAVILDILSELRAQMPKPVGEPKATMEPEQLEAEPQDRDFKLLTDYFQSVSSGN